MRYSVISKGLSLSQLQAAVQSCGGRNLKVATSSMQVFCELDGAGLAKIKTMPNLVVKGLGTIRAQQDLRPQQPIYAGSQLVTSSMYYQLREATTPPSIGTGWTVAVLDSGIRKTHRGLVDKIAYEANFTDSPTVDDIFSHGTACAFIIAGGRHAPGEECGVAPGADLMNIKVLGDDGSGTIEDAVLGIEHVIELSKDAQAKGLLPSDPMYPQLISISWGTEDDGDPDNPLRLVIAEARKAPLGIYAAAGNGGPDSGTILLPASCPEVWAVGVVTFVPYSVWPYSSRGPALDGTVKPDLVFYGVDILTAESGGDEVFGMKSGTSFSAPVICGGALVFMDILKAYGFRPPGDDYSKLGPAEMLPMLALMSRKPAGEPIGKDNTYGIGQPFGDLMIRGVSAGASPLGGILGMMPALILVGMMPGVMGEMAVS